MPITAAALHVAPADGSIRQHTVYKPAYAGKREHTSTYVIAAARAANVSSSHLRMSAYVSIRQHMSAYVSIRQHTATNVSIRQHT